MVWVRAAGHCEELRAARPPGTAPHPREADLATAGTEETGLWNNRNFIKLKSNVICCFGVFLNKMKIFLHPILHMHVF